MVIQVMRWLSDAVGWLSDVVKWLSDAVRWLSAGVAIYVVLVNTFVSSEKSEEKDKKTYLLTGA